MTRIGLLDLLGMKRMALGVGVLIVMMGGAFAEAERTEPITLSLSRDAYGLWWAPAWLDQPERIGGMLVDTGGAENLVVREALPPSTAVLKRADVIGSSGARTPGAYVSIRALHLSSSTLSDWRALALPARALTHISPNFPILGLFGAPFFKRFVVRLDPRHAILTLYPSGGSPLASRDSERPKSPKVEWLPARFEEALPLVTVTLNGRPGTFIVDTASTDHRLSPAFARSLTFEGGWERPLIAQDSIGAGRGVQVVQTGVARALQMGSVTFQNPILVVDPLAEFDGIIGTPILEHVVTWWDYPGGRWGLESVGGPSVVALSQYAYEVVPLARAMGAGEWAVALTLSRALKARYPAERKAALDEAECAFQGGFHAEAVSLLQAAWKPDDVSPQVSRQLGALFVRLSRFREAVPLLTRDLEPGWDRFEPQSYAHLAVAYASIQQPDEALTTLERMAERWNLSPWREPGSGGWDHLLSHPTLEKMRSHPRFRRLLEVLKRR